MFKAASQTRMGRQLPWWLLLGVGAIAGIAVSQQGWPYLAAVIAVLLLVLWPVQIALGGFAFLVPFDFSSTLGSSGEGITLTFLAGCIAVLVLLGFGMAFGRLEFPKRPALYWLLFVLWAAASCLWAYDQQAAFQRLPTILSLYMFYLVATCFRLTEREFSGIVALTILGGSIAAAFSAYEFYSGVSFHGLRSSLIIGGQTSDPNIFAASLLLPLSLAVGEFLAASALSRKLVMLFSSGVVALGMFLTMSRGALVAVAVMLLVYLRKLRMSWRVLVPTAALFGAFLLAPKLLQRLESGSGGASARIYIWETGLAAAKQFAAVGAGLSNFPLVYDRFRVDARDVGNGDPALGIRRDPHNIYLETMVELGAIGLILLITALTSQLRMAKHVQPTLRGIPANMRAIACQAAAWGMLAASFFLGMLWFKAFWLVWIMLTLASSERAEEPRPYAVESPAFESL